MLGFHPNITNPNTVYSRQGADILNVWYHRAGATGSGFISCTDSMKAANKAAYDARIGNLNIDTYVYLVKATGVLNPGRGGGEVIDNEYEYSVAGGIDADDIVAFIKNTEKLLQL